MGEVVAGEAVVEQSEVLSEGEVTNIVDGVEPEAAILPSDKVEFEVPEKFKDKSIEDVIKSYQELEKMKGASQVPEEGGDVKSEEKPNSASEPEEGGDKEPTKVEQEQYNKYADSYDKNGELSTAEYAELAKLGYDKTTVDKEIADRTVLQEFQTYKQEKTLNDVLEPLGGGQEKFKEVATWANENKDAAEVKAFNDTLASVPKMAQQALLKGLYAEYEASGQAIDTVLHTGANQSTPSKGYKTQEEFFKDVGSEEYQNNPKYREAVEAKMSRSDLFT